jgi:hypothetical protein
MLIAEGVAVELCLFSRFDGAEYDDVDNKPAEASGANDKVVKMAAAAAPAKLVYAFIGDIRAASSMMAPICIPMRRPRRCGCWSLSKWQFESRS